MNDLRFPSKEGSQKELIMQYMPLVKKIAKMYIRRLPEHVHIEDLISAGYVGLVEAAERYRPEHGSNFATFATWRIRGAMIDLVRTEDHLSRGERQFLKDAQDVERGLMLRGIKPTDSEIAQELGMDVEKYQQLRDATNRSFQSLDAPSSDDNEQAKMEIPDPSAVSPEKAARYAEISDAMKEKLGELTGTKRIVMDALLDDATAAEIAAEVGVLPPRISQIATEFRDSVEKRVHFGPGIRHRR
ncbi:MAG: sigma-70 family RNA polymerase sigma factor [Candidatus Kerfeldbacteria bacterium]|nr:sigma-70 family RNA polymerase sigma factor [Candidatus Kerfeldbacteria bacterium]